MKLPLDRTDWSTGWLVPVLALGAVGATRMRERRQGSGGGKFDVSGKVDHFAGPTPLVVRLSATAKNADGDVHLPLALRRRHSSTKTRGHRTRSRGPATTR